MVVDVSCKKRQTVDCESWLLIAADDSLEVFGSFLGNFLDGFHECKITIKLQMETPGRSWEIVIYVS